ncbi:short neuropeptide F [Eupeodes corollae]|uniref:short neuropeptide F n=1 Tax=Eupeodes corollae TaxID=290404 RepID=UPI002492989D|nr:short neuropeptide F [Eupeodes corollae]
MTSQRLLYGCGMIVLVSLLNGSSFAEMASTGNAINNLYENLLQREYAGPISFPERVERKAQRSPSLRLRFGRSDPNSEIFAMEEKRWFGDVDQKPIRSPSLRLRFGRTDPSMKAREPMHLDENEYQRIYQDEVISSIFNSEKLRNLLDELQALSDNQISSDEFQRDIRKQTPLRLRFGRSAGVSSSLTHDDTDHNSVESHNFIVPEPTEKA